MVELNHVPPWTVFRAGIAPGEKPHHVATRLLRKLGVHAPHVDVFELARRLGIEVRRDHQRPGWSGAIQSSEKRAVVWINAQEAEVRQRFTLAHELGHLFFHKLGTEFRDVTFRGNPKETEANQFAADLLMPLWMLEEYAPLGQDALVGRFQVSPHAMAIQCARMNGYPTQW